MIELTRLPNQKIIVNAELIEFVEETPDTLVSTTSGKRFLVRETPAEVVQKVVAYKRKCLARPARRDV